MICRVLGSRLSGSMSGFSSYPTTAYPALSLAYRQFVRFVGFSRDKRAPENFELNDASE